VIFQVLQEMAVVRKNGLLLSTVNPPSAEKAAAAGIRASFAQTDLDRAVMEKVLDWVALLGGRSCWRCDRVKILM
jgi:hypothetical protein